MGNGFPGGGQGTGCASWRNPSPPSHGTKGNFDENRPMVHLGRASRPVRSGRSAPRFHKSCLLKMDSLPTSSSISQPRTTYLRSRHDYCMVVGADRGPAYGACANPASRGPDPVRRGLAEPGFLARDLQQSQIPRSPPPRHMSAQLAAVRLSSAADTAYPAVELAVRNTTAPAATAGLITSSTPRTLHNLGRLTARRLYPHPPRPCFAIRDQAPRSPPVPIA